MQAVEAASAVGGQSQQQPFDVSLMDMCLPVMGGVEATQVRGSGVLGLEG